MHLMHCNVENVKPIIHDRKLSSLVLESDRLLPAKVLVREVAVLSSLAVDRLGKVKGLDDDTRSHVEVVAHDLHQLLGALVGGTVSLNEERERLSHTDGVGQLNKRTASELGVHKRLGDPASEVSSGTVDLAVVLARESTTTVSTPATVGVNDDLTASETGVTLWATNDEHAGRLNVIDRLVIQQVVGDDGLDDLLGEDLAELLDSDLRSMLGGDDDGVDTLWHNGTVVVLVFDRDLGLGVRSQPWDGAVVTGVGHGLVELVGELDGHGQHLRRLVSGITEHNTLVTSTELLKSLLVVQTLSNVRALLLNGDQDIAGLVVEALV